VLRALDELAHHLGDDGLPDRRFARMLATVRADGWQQIMAGNRVVRPALTAAGQPLTRTAGDDHEATPVMVIRVDAAIIEAASMKSRGDRALQGCDENAPPAGVVQPADQDAKADGEDHREEQAGEHVHGQTVLSRSGRCTSANSGPVITAASRGADKQRHPSGTWNTARGAR
jgi:hypothetical protein